MPAAETEELLDMLSARMKERMPRLVDVLVPYIEEKLRPTVADICMQTLGADMDGMVATINALVAEHRQMKNDLVKLRLDVFKQQKISKALTELINELVTDTDEASLCVVCGTETATKACVRCEKLLYCSKDCAKQNFQAHKKECKKI